MLGKVRNTNLSLILTVDDKGMKPSDHVYEGTISPPRTDLILTFNIQWYKSETQLSGNGRVFSVYSGGGLNISEDGSRWFVDLNNLPDWVDPPRDSSFNTAGMYELTITANGSTSRGSRRYFVADQTDCTPTVLDIPEIILPAVEGNYYQYSYRVNGGEVLTAETNAGGENSTTVIINLLAYQGFFANLVTHSTGQKAFQAKYGQPVRGGSVNDPNFIQAQSNTIELLLTPNAEHDLIHAIFGDSIAIHSCAIVDWK